VPAPPVDTTFPVSGSVARFVDRLTTLSAREWDEIQVGVTKLGLHISMLEASRNASVALAVRDMITREQFDHLYGPFSRVIPIGSLDGALASD
jgi:pyruvate/2-oxoglutarate/acetoin dehydrogenase E1 component